MSFFDSIADFITGNTSVIAPIIGGVGAIAGSVIASNANTEAAEIAAQATNRQIDAIERGNRLAQQRFDDIRADTAPGVGRLRTTALTSPDVLTPEQEFQLSEARDRALTGLNASGLRGSGRATAAVLSDVESNFRNVLLGQNRNRADAAARTLAGQNFSAQTSAANIDASGGRDVGAAQERIGGTVADSVTANGRLTGQALADVGSIIADVNKKRESRFAQTDEEPERREQEPV